jgi:hypothetical protein
MTLLGANEVSGATVREVGTVIHDECDGLILCDWHSQVPQVYDHSFLSSLFLYG